MSRAFVLGNGRSRLNADPYFLKTRGTIYACNAIYRDFLPDYLIAVDAKMVVELIEHDVPSKVSVWTNRNSKTKDFKNINFFEPNKGWSSGPTALWLATQTHNEIFILGFDFQGLNDHTKFNNVYADTNNYKKSSDAPTFYGNWMNQTEQVIRENKNVKYFRVIEDGQYIPDWKSLDNLEHIDFSTFNSMLNNQD